MKHALHHSHAVLRPLVLVVLCSLLAFAGCARAPMRGAPAPAPLAVSTWQAYESYVAATRLEASPYRLEASLRYDVDGDGHRVVALIWSNGGSTLRLDIMAGIGATVAKIRETDDTFLAYSPNEHKAYYHQGAGKALFSFGVPVPFSVTDLAALLDGQFGAVFASQYTGEPTLVTEGGIAYTLAGARTKGTLEVSPEGLPVRWTDATPGGWNLDIAYPSPDASTAAPLPKKLTFTHGKGYTAILLVKDRERLAIPFTDEQLGLQLPDDTAVLPLRTLSRK